MSRKTQKQKRLGASRTPDECSFPFHSLVPFSTTTSIGLSPNATLTARGATEADAWAHFRVRKLKFRILPVQNDTDAITGSASIGFLGGMQDTAPSTTAQNMELLPAVAITVQQTVPTTWVKVPKSDLAGALPWYKTIPGTADTTEEAPGLICWVSSVTGDPFMQVEFMGEFQFKTSVATANTPAALKARQVLHDYRVRTVDNEERERLIKLLSPVIPGLALQLSTKTPLTPIAGSNLQP